MRTDLSRPSHEATGLVTPRGRLCLAAAISFFLTMLVVGSIPGKALASVAMLASLDEIIQGFFPYRSSNLTDLLADLTAALVTIALLSLVNAFVNAAARKDASASYRSPPPSNCAHEDHHHR